MSHKDCWHFAGEILRDGEPLPKKGDVLTHEGAIKCCESGYHGSTRAIDALEYAPGTMVARVRLSGDMESQSDKHCARVRENLTDYVDATRVLHEFACWYATGALDAEEAAGRNVDPRSRRAIEVKLAWLDGDATDDEQDAAWGAAWDAARAAQNVELERKLAALTGEA